MKHQHSFIVIKWVYETEEHYQKSHSLKAKTAVQLLCQSCPTGLVYEEDYSGQYPRWRWKEKKVEIEKEGKKHD